MWLYKGHGGDHERKGISADIRVFSAALIREQEPRSIRSLIFSAAQGSVVEGIAARFSVETFTSAEIDKIAARGG